MAAEGGHRNRRLAPKDSTLTFRYFRPSKSISAHANTPLLQMRRQREGGGGRIEAVKKRLRSHSLAAGLGSGRGLPGLSVLHSLSTEPHFGPDYRLGPVFGGSSRRRAVTVAEHSSADRRHGALTWRCDRPYPGSFKRERARGVRGQSAADNERGLDKPQDKLSMAKPWVNAKPVHVPIICSCKPGRGVRSYAARVRYYYARPPFRFG